MKKIFGMVIDHEKEIEKLIAINKKLYDKIEENFKEFYIINLKNFKLFKNKINLENTKSKNLSNLPKGFKIFTPQNSNDLKEFLVDKKLTAFLNIGRNFEHFYIHRLLKKNNVNLILLINFGGFGNPNIEVVLTKNIKFFTYAIIKVIRVYLVRIFALLNIFPRIKICFESNPAAAKNLNQGISKKIEKIIPFLKVSYYEKVIPINSISADKLLQSGNELNKDTEISEEIITFIDSDFFTGDRIDRGDSFRDDSTIKYFENLKKLLNDLSEKFKKKIIISLHPQTNTEIYRKYLSNFNLEKYNTSKNIVKSFIVVFHESTAIDEALLLKKKIICVKSKFLGDYMNLRIDRLINRFGLFKASLEDLEKVDMNNLVKNLDEKIANYKNYKEEYIHDRVERGDDKVIRIIKEMFF